MSRDSTDGYKCIVKLALFVLLFVEVEHPIIPDLFANEICIIKKTFVILGSGNENETINSPMSLIYIFNFDHTVYSKEYLSCESLKQCTCGEIA